MHTKSSYVSQIEQKLQPLSPLFLDVTDDSHHHQGHTGYRGDNGGSHFSIRIISKQFNSLSKVARHRLIYQLLDTEMKTHIHALAIEAVTPEEVKSRQPDNKY